MPIPARIRLLRELEFDLEALRSRFEQEGRTAEEARHMALEALVPDSRAARELARLHAPAYRRMTGHLTENRLRALERSALALATLVVLTVATRVLLQADLLRDPSPFMWPVLALGAASFAVVMRQVFVVWVKGDHRPAEQMSRVMLGAAGITMTAGVLGVLLDGYRRLVLIENDPWPVHPHLFQWIEREAALLAVALVLALACGLAWFVLTRWSTVVSGAWRETLELDSTQTPR